MNEIKAIETKYKGYRFRSRLEARWAVYFDTLGVAWEYEPEGFDLGNGLYYLPDFKIKCIDCIGPVGYDRNWRWVYVEVKGGIKNGINLKIEDKKKITSFVKSGNEIILLGDIPDPDATHIFTKLRFENSHFYHSEHYFLWPSSCNESLIYIQEVDDNTLYIIVGDIRTVKRIDSHSPFYIENVSDSQLDSSFFLSNWEFFGKGGSKATDLAAKAARSARFEHGECG